MRAALLAAALAAFAALAAPAAGQEPAPAAPADAPTQAAPADEARGAPAGAAESPDAEGPPPRVRIEPGDGVLPPPRAIASPPARRRWPEDLVRRTSLSVNLLGLVPGPESGAAGTWRAEGVLERAFRPHIGAAAILSAGRARKDGHDDAWALALSGQYRWYFAGRFDRGFYAAGTLGFWSIDPYLAWALGGGVGVKRAFSGGLTVDLLAGLQLPVEWFRRDQRGDPPPLRDAWQALLPGPLVSLGFSVDERARLLRRR